jgi:hypothetical protein
LATAHVPLPTIGTVLEGIRRRAGASIETVQLRAGIGKQSRALAQWYTELSRAFLEPLLARLAASPLDKAYREALKTWAVAACWGVASMLGATAGERRWGRQKCFGRWQAYQGAAPDDACQAANMLFAWYLTAPGNAGRFNRHGHSLLEDFGRLAAPGPWTMGFATFALELSRLEERGELTSRGPLLAPLVFGAMGGDYPSLEAAIERVQSWAQEHEMGLADLMDWIPGLELPDPDIVLNITSGRKREIRNLRREHGSGELFRLLAAALCGVELSRFLEALAPAVRQAYSGASIDQLLRYSLLNGSPLNRSRDRPLTAGRARPTPLGGLEADIALGGRLVAEMKAAEAEEQRSRSRR